MSFVSVIRQHSRRQAYNQGMKYDNPRFALFGGCTYYPKGGMYDLELAGDLEECKRRFSTWGVPDSHLSGTSDWDATWDFEWAHIVDLSSMEVVFVAEGDGSKAVIWRTVTRAD